MWYTFSMTNRKYCPTCEGKAQSPRMMDPMVNEDGELIDGAPAEPCDEPYHDQDDPEYRED